MDTGYFPRFTTDTFCPMNNNLVVCSMFRSGGTLIYNILEEVVKKNNLPMTVAKRHLDWKDDRKQWYCLDECYNPERDILIYSHRDIDAVVDSLCRRDRVERKNFDTLFGRPLEDWKAWVLDQHRRISKEPCLFFSYENVIDGRELELQNTLERFLEVPLSRESNFLRPKMKAYTDSLKEYDRWTQFWPNHIS